MYPFIRFFLAMIRAYWRGPVAFDCTYETHHTILPNDIDIFGELNNGRMLSILDLNRLPFGYATGLLRVIRQNHWGLTIAGVSVRYRRRVKMFDRVRITTTAVGRDARFIYLLQTMWKGDEAACNALYRAAIYTKDGIVPTQKILDALGGVDWNPNLPDWVHDWIEAEAKRPWPPIY